MWTFILFTFILLSSSLVNCYEILGLFPHAGRSHFNAFEPLLKKLASKGHNVTVISHFPQKNPLATYNDVSLEGTDDSCSEWFTFQQFTYTNLMKYYEPLYLAKLGINSCKNAFQSNELLTFLKKNDAHFDLIITEFFNSDCLLGFVHKYKAPLIGMSSNTIMPWMHMRFGNVEHPAYVPNNFLDHTDRMSFMQRVESTIMNVFVKFVYYYLIDIPTYDIVKPYFGDDLPLLSDIAMNSTLFLTNTHFSLFSPRPLVPSVIEVSGLHIGDVKPLPKVLFFLLNRFFF